MKAIPNFAYIWKEVKGGVFCYVTVIYVDFPDGVGHRHETVAKIVVFARFYSKNRGKSTYTVTRKIDP